MTRTKVYLSDTENRKSTTSTTLRSVVKRKWCSHHFVVRQIREPVVNQNVSPTHQITWRQCRTSSVNIQTRSVTVSLPRNDCIVLFQPSTGCVEVQCAEGRGHQISVELKYYCSKEAF
jgi:hypothetical protein